MPGKKGSAHGFAVMDEEARREASRRGGLNARNNPNVHRWKRGSQEAIDAGRRGGKASRRTKGVQ